MSARIYALPCLLVTCVVQADDQIDRYKAALQQKMLRSYQLSFTVTYPKCMTLPVYEKITTTYCINENNGYRLSTITTSMGGKPKVSRKLITPNFVTIHDDDSAYVTKYTASEGKGKYKEHDIDYVKLGKHPRSFGVIANDVDNEDYVLHFMKNEYKGKSVDDKGIVTHTYQGKISIFSLKFSNQSASLPMQTSITAHLGKEGKSVMIDTINCEYTGSSELPLRIEYTRTLDNVVREHQVISDIKLEPVNSKLAFNERELEIKVNTDALVDNALSKFWNGDTYSDRPVTNSSVVFRINYYYLVNGIVLTVFGTIVLYLKLYRRRSLKSDQHET